MKRLNKKAEGQELQALISVSVFFGLMICFSILFKIATVNIDSDIQGNPLKVISTFVWSMFRTNISNLPLPLKFFIIMPITIIAGWILVSKLLELLPG